MHQTHHRSENLWIGRHESGGRAQVEIRLGIWIARGEYDDACPRCGCAGSPRQWELEGPDGSRNLVWLSCDSPSEGPRRHASVFGWVQRVDFGGAWEER